MNIEKKIEKKEYVAPTMEIIQVKAESSLLACSLCDEEPDDADGYDGYGG